MFIIVYYSVCFTNKPGQLRSYLVTFKFFKQKKPTLSFDGDSFIREIVIK